MTAREDVFEGVAAPLPGDRSAAFGWRLTWAGGESAIQPIRHRSGYAHFLDFVNRADADARALSANPLALLRFLHTHIGELMADPELKEAATVFLGNTLAALREDAAWGPAGDGTAEVGAGRRSYVVHQVLERLAKPLTGSLDDGPVFASDDDWLHAFAASLTEWVDEKPDDVLPALPLPVPAQPATQKYRRLLLPERTFLDAAGEPIPYGRRWGDDGPDEASYSVTSNLERFATLHSVAHALVEYVEQVYDVDVQQIDPGDLELLQPHEDVWEIVRLSPRSADGAPLVFVLTGFPGVMVEAGVLHSVPFPACGCDACDDDIQAVAGELEELVLAVARGGFAEQYPVSRRMETDFAQVSTDDAGSVTGSRGGRGEPPRLSPERLSAAAARLAALPDGWQPWPLRSAVADGDIL